MAKFYVILIVVFFGLFWMSIKANREKVKPSSVDSEPVVKRSRSAQAVNVRQHDYPVHPLSTVMRRRAGFVTKPGATVPAALRGSTHATSIAPPVQGGGTLMSTRVIRTTSVKSTTTPTTTATTSSTSATTSTPTTPTSLSSTTTVAITSSSTLPTTTSGSSSTSSPTSTSTDTSTSTAAATTSSCPCTIHGSYVCVVGADPCAGCCAGVYHCQPSAGEAFCVSYGYPACCH